MELLPELEGILNEHGPSERTGSPETFYFGRNSWVGKEYENAPPVRAVPKIVNVYNTDLDAPYVGGNFNFLYNGGAEAVVTLNAYLSWRKNFTAAQKQIFVNNLTRAVAVWDSAAELQVRDVGGNYNERIKLRFKLNIVRDPKNANKTIDVHPGGTRSAFFMQKNRENVMREVNVFIGSSRNVLVHELGHVWGLLDEYKDMAISMKLSLGHVGGNSPLLNDKISIMNEGYMDEALNNGEFRGRYFKHFGRKLLKSFQGLKNHIIPLRQNGKTLSNNIYGRIALLKKDIAGTAPYPGDVLPFNPQFTPIQIAWR